MLQPGHIRDVLEQFTFSSAVDVLLIAVLIYAALRLLSGTRAMTQLRGVIALFLVSIIVSGIHISIVNVGRIIGDIPISYSFVTIAVPVGSFLMLLTTGKKVYLLFRAKAQSDQG